MSRHFLLGLALLVFALGIWRYSRTPTAPVINPAGPGGASASSVQVATSDGLPLSPLPEASAGDSLSPDLAARKFGRAISEASACLGVPMILPDGPVPPTLTEWLAAARNELGDPVVTTEDWSVTTIQTPSGEKRHIRFEIDYSDPGNIVQKLSYYLDRGDGTAQVIPLDPQQAVNPSETFKATLESDGEVLEREKSQRIYFETGEEIVVTEKNAQIVEIDMNRQGKSFSCRPFDPGEGACGCR